jgi:oligoendopeptidase F
MVLLEALNDYETWKRECGTGGNVDYYFWLRNKQDTNNPNLKAKLNNINDFSNKMANDILFFELMLAKIDQKKQIEFLAAPELIDYHSFLESLFKCSKHLLSENEEKIILLKKKVSYTNWVDMLNSFLVKSEREVIVSDGTLKKMSFSEIVELTKDSNKKIRNSAVKAYNEIITTNLDVAEEEMNSILSDKKIDDELRGYSLQKNLVYLTIILKLK